MNDHHSSTPGRGSAAHGWLFELVCFVLYTLESCQLQLGVFYMMSLSGDFIDAQLQTEHSDHSSQETLGLCLHRPNSDLLTNQIVAKNLFGCLCKHSLRTGKTYSPVITNHYPAVKYTIYVQYSRLNAQSLENCEQWKARGAHEQKT